MIKRFKSFQTMLDCIRKTNKVFDTVKVWKEIYNQIEYDSIWKEIFYESQDRKDSFTIITNNRYWPNKFKDASIF